jgi:hypothetical protein
LRTPLAPLRAELLSSSLKEPLSLLEEFSILSA